MGSVLHGAGFQAGALSPFSQAALAIWSIILRFMGDLPEPVLFTRNTLRGGSVMRQIHDALGKEGSTQPPQHSRSAQVRHEGGAKGRCPPGVPRPRAWRSWTRKGRHSVE